MSSTCLLGRNENQNRRLPRLLLRFAPASATFFPGRMSYTLVCPIRPGRMSYTPPHAKSATYVESLDAMVRFLPLLIPLLILVTSCFRPRAAQVRSDGMGLNAGGVRDRAAFDFNCAADEIQVQDIDGRDLTFGARGCGKRATYVWRGSTVILNSEIVHE